MYDVLIAQAWLGEVPVISPLWSAVWPYLVMLGGFSVIIFVHELGHFAVAKWVDVRVEQFAIGFGRELFGFTRGETRYSFNILPLGGYVKMLGQEDFDDKTLELKADGDPRSFPNKSIGRRMAIVSAGVVMNVLFACLLFAIIFLVGMEVQSTRIGFVLPDSAADRAGLRSGDEIKAINGRHTLEAQEVSMDIFLAPPYEPIDFTVERNGVREHVAVTPDYDQPSNTRDPRRLLVGVGFGVTQEIAFLGVGVDGTLPDSPHIGDRIVEVGGHPVTEQNATEIMNMLGYESGQVFVERKDPENPDGSPLRVEVAIPIQLAVHPSELGEPDSASILGLTPLAQCNEVDPKGRGALAGIEPGDTVLVWDDQSHPSGADIARAIRDQAGKDIYFVMLKPDERRVSGFVRPELHKSGQATIHASCVSTKRPKDDKTSPRARFAHVRSGGMLDKAGVEDGDTILRCQSIKNPSKRTVNKVVWEGAGKAISFQVAKSDGTELTFAVQPAHPGSIDAQFRLFAENTLLVGNIAPRVNGLPSPAAEAGIPPGALIVSVDRKPVQGWKKLISAFQDKAEAAARMAQAAKDDTKNKAAEDAAEEQAGTAEMLALKDPITKAAKKDITEEKAEDTQVGKAGVTVELAFMDPVTKIERSVPFFLPQAIRPLLGIGPAAKIVSIDGKRKVTVGSGEASASYHLGTRKLLEGLIGQKQVPVEYSADPFSPVQTAYIDVTEGMVDPWVGRVLFQPNIMAMPDNKTLKGDGILDSIAIGVHKTHYFVMQVYETLNRMIFSRSVSLKSMSGPLGIINMGGKVAEQGPIQFLFFMALISANLAVLNFLPLPIVDGGLMVFLIIEKIKGSPVSMRVTIATQMIGIVLLAGTFLFITYQDAIRLFG